MKNQKKLHYTYIDILRIVAILAVLIQHSAEYYMDGCYGNGFLANAFRGATRWNILIFVLISGILFLGRDISLEMMWKKYIFRILKAFCIWSAAYTIYYCTSAVD